MAAKKKTKRVFVGLSGGVDSAVSAYLLRQAGYEVTGVYMKNWTTDIGNHRCPWRADYLAAKEVAAYLKIRFLEFDFQQSYRNRVVDYMLREYAAGRTPNPDVWCNQTIKFDLFLDHCLSRGADLIATGHYARLRNGILFRAEDFVKDQTYFLYRMPDKALSATLFPLGDYRKTEVRQMGQKIGLPNAKRPESMGICFVGEVGLGDFLATYLDLTPGNVIDDDCQEVIGQHRGAARYTLGQRHGLNIGGGLPYYVVGKDMDQNIVRVSRNLRHPALWVSSLRLASTRWLAEPPVLTQAYEVRLRHGADFWQAKCQAVNQTDQTAIFDFGQSIQTTAAGQSVVIYEGQRVVGGGLLTDL